MIKLIVGAGEVLVFLLILFACGYLVYLGIRLWDKARSRKMVQRLMKSDATEPTSGLSPAAIRRSIPRMKASAAAT